MRMNRAPTPRPSLAILLPPVTRELDPCFAAILGKLGTVTVITGLTTRMLVHNPVRTFAYLG